MFFNGHTDCFGDYTAKTLFLNKLSSPLFSGKEKKNPAD